MTDVTPTDELQTETPPADNHRERDTTAAKDQISPELLKALESNYRSRHYGIPLKYAAALLAGIAIPATVAWYLVADRPVQTRSSSKPAVRAQAAIPSPPAAKAPTASPPAANAPSTAPAATAAPVQRAMSTPPKANAAATTKLPAFVPAIGQDKTYSRHRPDWERYIDPKLEYRIFRPNGRIKAVQVLSTNQHAISEKSLKSILKELLGSSDYRVISREQKEGFSIVRGSVNHKGGVVIYTQRAKLLAFVVSLD